LETAWVDPQPTGFAALWSRPRFLFVGARPGELPDVFLGQGRFDTGGHLRALSEPRSLSRTPGARERSLRVAEGRAAWLVGPGDASTAAELAAFEPLRTPFDVVRCWIFASASCPGGAVPPEQANWSALERWQDRISRWQELGIAGHVSRARVRIEPPSRDAEIGWSAEQIQLDANGERIVSRFPLPSAAEGRVPALGPEESLWEVEPSARPGNVTTWLAETLRDTSLGDRGVALLKALGFAGRDYAARAASALAKTDPTELIDEDLGGLLSRRATAVAGGAWEGWPPAPLAPPLGKALENEGVWLSLDDDPFVARGPEGRAPFVFSFVRPDPQRPYVRVYVVLWDPRRVELHAVGGTVEPRSSTGERGSGRVPRDPKVLRRLAGAFNGGFRTRHGEFGMAAGGTVYLPPKPYAATIATLADGSTALGTWPDRPGLPRDVVSYRQNLTPLLQDGVANPYRRHYWGGLPEGWQHESYTVRTALCLTRDGYLAYLYGDHLNPSSLVAAAQAARCDYALHLDMNAGHTGFELYRVFDGAAPPSVTSTLESSWQAHGSITGAPGYEYLARRLTKHMPLMNFPRYVHREQRDFFYLTLRPGVGARPLPQTWGARGPHGGWHLDAPGPQGAPSAWAFADVRPFSSAPEETLHVLMVDPRRVEVTPGDSRRSSLTDDSPVQEPFALTASTRSRAALDAAVADRPSAVVESGLAPGLPEGPRLWWSPERFVASEREPSPWAVCVARLSPAAPTQRARAVALAGIDDEGFLVYAEVRAGRTALAEELTEVARALALQEHVVLGERLTWRFAGDPTAVAAGESAPPYDRHALSPQAGAVRPRALQPRTPHSDTQHSESHHVAATEPRAAGRLYARVWAVEGPGAVRLFPDTPVVSPEVWAYRQLEHLSLEPEPAAPSSGDPPR
jgi:hypothetical protein